MELIAPRQLGDISFLSILLGDLCSKIEKFKLKIEHYLLKLI